MPNSSRHRPPVRIRTQVQTNAILTSGAALCSNLCSARLRSLRSRVAPLAGALFSAGCPARWRSFRRSARWRSRSLRRWVLRSPALASPLLHWWLAPALGGRRWVSSLREGTKRVLWVATHSVPQESHLTRQKMFVVRKHVANSWQETHGKMFVVRERTNPCFAWSEIA